jgi:predicted Rdx family selenoprotein
VAEINGTEHTAEMASGENGQFDVYVDEAIVFSKQRAGRWPELAEILAALPEAQRP